MRKILQTTFHGKDAKWAHRPQPSVVGWRLINMGLLYLLCNWNRIGGVLYWVGREIGVHKFTSQSLQTPGATLTSSLRTMFKYRHPPAPMEWIIESILLSRPFISSIGCRRRPLFLVHRYGHIYQSVAVCCSCPNSISIKPGNSLYLCVIACDDVPFNTPPLARCTLVENLS